MLLKKRQAVRRHHIRIGHVVQGGCCRKFQHQYASFVIAAPDAANQVNFLLFFLEKITLKFSFSNGLNDRFYSAVYRKLTDPTLLQASGQKHYTLFFHLLYQVMGRDSSDRRVLAFVKRLLQSALCNSASFAVAALMLLSNLLSRRPSLRKLEKRDQVRSFLFVKLLCKTFVFIEIFERN